MSQSRETTRYSMVAALGAALLCSGCLIPEEKVPPQVSIFDPVPGMQYIGVGLAQLEIDITDENRADRDRILVDVLVDGAVVNDVPLRPEGDCTTRCTVLYALDTLPFAEGEHELTVVATDSADLVTSSSVTVSFHDMIYVDSIEVQNEVELSELDIEVHLYDATNGVRLGCSGVDSGMRHVDDNNMRYNVVGYFERAGQLPLSAADLWDLQLQLIVVEDDIDPCPGPELPEDDIVGQGPVFAGSEVPTTFAFEDVVHIGLDIGRPL